LSSDLDFLPPAKAEAIAEAESAVGPLPAELREILELSNGLINRSFRLYSVFDQTNPKKTWESLQRANHPQTARSLGGDPELLRRFLVIADIGGGYAALDRSDGSIWFEETGGDGELHQTDLTFREFIETMMENAE